MTITRTALPRLRRRVTAYTFLAKVLPKVILAEPRRMRMGIWQLQAWKDMDNRPACGTVGCIGGWTEIMTGRRAARVLGLRDQWSKASRELFFGPLTNDLDQGMPLHARRVVAHLKRFATKYRATLRQTVIEPYTP